MQQRHTRTGMTPIAYSAAEKEERIHLLRIGLMVSYVKLRPHLFYFLEQAAKLFECHLYTLGSRDYAHALLPVWNPVLVRAPPLIG